MTLKLGMEHPVPKVNKSEIMMTLGRPRAAADIGPLFFCSS